LTGLEKTFNVVMTFINIISAFKDNGAASGKGENVCRKQSGGTGTDYDWGFQVRFSARNIGFQWLSWDMFATQISTVPDFKMNPVSQTNTLSTEISGINPAPDDPVSDNVVLSQTGIAEDMGQQMRIDIGRSPPCRDL
jgi:hypothetical protein